MSKIKSFFDLDVWKKAHAFVLKLYKKTNNFPKEERYGITNQLRRSAVSITTNICEGTGRYTTKELLYFLNVSRGSLEETKYLVLLVKDLEFIETQTYDELKIELDEIGKMLNGLINSLRSNIVNDPELPYGNVDFPNITNH